MKNFIATTALVALALATPGWAGSEKLSTELQAGRPEAGNVEVIVQYKASPTAAHHARVTRRGGRLRHAFSLWGSFIPDCTPVYPDACAPSQSLAAHKAAYLAGESPVAGN